MTTYGVSTDMMHGGDSFLMLTGVEVTDVSELQPELTALRLPAQHYAVFTHRGHISAIRTTVHSICSIWLSTSGMQLSGNPDLIERYDERYDPPSGTGEVEIWISVRA